MRRRDLLASAAAFSLSALAGRAGAQASPAPSRIDALLDAFFDENLERSPENATELGLDKGAKAGLKARLGDTSPAGYQAERAANASQLRRLAALDRNSLSTGEKVRYDTIAYFETANRDVLAFDFVGLDGFSPSPYVVSPITGAYQRVPVFLDTKHSIETTADAEAYLSRLDAFAAALDGDTERFRAETAKGIIAPDFVLDTTLEQLAALNTAPGASGLVTSLDRRARAKGLGETWGSRAEKLYAERVAPALGRQIDAAKAARAQAGHAPGVDRFKDGAAFYRANLRYTTTTDLTPDEIHKIGLDQAQEIGARLDTLLKAQGMTRGTVGERIASIYKDPAQFYPNTPAGKEKLIADLQARLDRVRARLPRMFNKIPHSAIEVRAVPAAIDAGAPLAYSETPPLDGSRPGFIYFNLHDTAEWPRFDLPSTLYHEGLPGHQLQGGIALENTAIPVLLRNLYFPGYSEGWALYAEQLADELGMYDDDPLGRIGWLKEQIFRAGRCVVDTGMHHLGWSREKAIAYLVALNGDAVGSTTREVDRYVAIPAQACSYKLGHNAWNRLRDRARAELGPRFDIHAFHDAGLDPGCMPLAVLDTVIADWTRSVKA
jgi:uncharacterized protein (DUF885 family)